MTRIEVYGLGDTLKAMKVFSPNALKEYKKEVKAAAGIIVKVARGSIPAEPPMRNWRKIPAKKSRGTPRPHSNPRSKPRGELGSDPSTIGWPVWDTNAIRKGIKVTTSKDRDTGSVKASLLRVENQSASGAIFEVAGRRSRGASPSGVQFIRNLTRFSNASRAIWRAYDQNQDTVTESVQQAIDKAIAQFQRDVAESRDRS